MRNEKKNIATLFFRQINSRRKNTDAPTFCSEISARVNNPQRETSFNACSIFRDSKLHNVIGVERVIIADTYTSKDGDRGWNMVNNINILEAH